MDNKKFEQLIDLIINENEDQARALFHDIVVEKSREIYESLMDEEMDDMAEDDGTQVGGLLDEISADEEGMTEDEDLEFDDEEVELGDEEDMGDEGEEDLEDRVVDLEDKLDQLMAEFEEIMGSEEGEEEGEEGEEMDFDAEEEGEEEGEEGAEEMMEAVELKQVPGLYGSKIGGDNGANAKTPVAANAGARGMASKPVKFSGDAEAMPTSPKAPSNAYAKGEGEVKHAGQWKNAPAQAGQHLDKAPAPVKTQASGVNTTSPVAESRKTAKKRI